MWLFDKAMQRVHDELTKPFKRICPRIIPGALGACLAFNGDERRCRRRVDGRIVWPHRAHLFGLYYFPT
ncbi:MAG: hypothetical protein CM15mP46_0340 [Alphaproteobacteria bacterium]|nr:MAG: hypothetical protein CM15mP46_0340 [Alphaproteobacteria bacterium]